MLLPDRVVASLDTKSSKHYFQGVAPRNCLAQKAGKTRVDNKIVESGGRVKLHRKSILTREGEMGENEEIERARALLREAVNLYAYSRISSPEPVQERAWEMVERTALAFARRHFELAIKT